MNFFTSALINGVVASPFGQTVVGCMFAPNKFLCFRLLWMAKNDQQARQAFLNGRAWDNEIDQRNTKTMKRIIAQYGWPGEKLVGKTGAQAAWLLVQHADHDRDFQKKCHTLLKLAVKSNDARATHLAYLTDRICVGDSLPQIYGTQLEYPIADQEHVDERRAMVGLPSMAEYLASSSQIQELVKKRRGSLRDDF
jgi:hypothetical protein